MRFNPYQMEAKEFPIQGETKPTYDIGFWEYVYELQQKPFLKLLEHKAHYLQKLEEKDLFSLPEATAKRIAQQIKFLTSELNVLYGMKLFMDDLKNCYLDSSVKIYDTYHVKNFQLEAENQLLKNRLITETDNSQLYLQLILEARRQIQEFKNQLQ